MSDRVGALLHKALQTLEPDERDELLNALLLGRLDAGTFSPAGLLGVAGAPRLTVDRERLASMLGFGFGSSSSASAPLKVLPVRLPEAHYERLRDFCQASGFSMAVVIRTLVERFLDQQGAASRHP